MLQSVLAIIASLFIEESGLIDGAGVFATAAVNYRTATDLAATLEVEAEVWPTKTDGPFKVCAKARVVREGRKGYLRFPASGWHRTVEEAVAAALANAKVESGEIAQAFTDALRAELWECRQILTEEAAQRAAEHAERMGVAVPETDWVAYADELTAEWVAPMPGQLVLV